MALNKNAKAWVRALRSGKYKKGKCTLRPTTNTYCCLGVACDLYAKAHKAKEPGYLEVAYLEALPNKVRKWLGLSDPEGEFVDEKGETEHLSNLNDNTNYSFKDIADVIESRPKGLFI